MLFSHFWVVWPQEDWCQASGYQMLCSGCCFIHGHNVGVEMSGPVDVCFLNFHPAGIVFWMKIDKKKSPILRKIMNWKFFSQVGERESIEFGQNKINVFWKKNSWMRHNFSMFRATDLCGEWWKISVELCYTYYFVFLGWLINWREISNVLRLYTLLLPMGLAHVCPTAFPNAAMEEWFPTENALRVPLLHHSLSAFFLVPSYLVLIQGILCIAWFLVLPKWMRTKQDFFGGLFAFFIN